MVHGAAVSWVCGTDTFQIWDTKGRVFADCFADAGLIATSAVIFLIGQAWPCRTGSTPKDLQYGDSPQAKKHILETWHIPSLLAASLVATWVVFFLLEGIFSGYTSIAYERPHVFIAGALQSFAWLAALVSLQRSKQPQHWLVLASCHLQPLALGLVILPRAIAGALPREDVPLAVAFGLELAFVVAVDWQQAAQHAQLLSNPLHQPLLGAREEAAERSPSSLSQLAFSWVTPLISLGSRRQLQHDDMLALPPALDPQHCRCLMWQQWHQAKEHAEEQAKQKGEQTRNVKVSLWRALWTGFGWPYISLGLLKLFSDALNFAGPLLLNALLKYLGQGSDPVRNNERPVEQARPEDMRSMLHRILSRDSSAYGCCLVALLGLTAVLKGVLNTQYSFRRGVLACQLRAALSALVFDKTLMVSTADMAGFSAGTVQTMMSVDADRVVNMFSWVHELWSLPLQIVVALGLLYTQVRLAFLGGLAVVLLLVPINKWLAKRIEAATNTKMTFKDLRVKRTGELLRGIHQIKAAAWEPAFMAHIREAREGELQALSVEKYLDALCVYFWAATSILTSIITFTLYALLGYHLTADVVFTSLALFNVLIVPLNGFPWVINGLIEALVSVRRLQRYLSTNSDDSDWQPHPSVSSKAAARQGPAWKDTSAAAEPNPKPGPWWRFGLGTAKRGDADETASLLPKQAVPLSFDIPEFRRQHATAAEMPSGQSACAVLLQDASFAWATQAKDSAEDSHADKAKQPASAPMRGWAMAQSRDVLRVLSLAIPQGSLTAIVGDIGSGKSSFLAAILGELRGTCGRVKIQGSLAYVPQQPWVMSGTLRDNILFKKQLDEQRYRRVLEACALDVDVKLLPAGDGTWIGDKGATISGGQRARLALARAIYQDCDIYLLDDVLAAVDASVAALLWERAICGLLRSKTRLVRLLDPLITLKESRTWLKSHMSLVVTHSQRFASLSETVLRLDRGEIAYMGAPNEDPFRLWGPEPGAAQDDVKGKGKALARSWSSPDANLLEEQHGPSSAPPEDHSAAAAAALPVDGASNMESAEKVEAALDAQAQQQEDEEARQEGHVQAHVYLAYGRAAGWTIMAVLAVSFIIMQATQNGSDLWLSYWVSHEHKERLRLGGTAGLGSPALPGLPAGHPGLHLGETAALQGSSWTWAGALVPFRQGAEVPLYNSTGALGQNATAVSKHHFDYFSLGSPANPTWNEVQRGFWRLGQGLGHTQQRLWIGFESQLQPGVRFYLTVLLTIAAANSVFILLRAFSFAKGGLVAAQEMHAALLGAVVRAPLSFFNRTPPGRVLNRFSSDMDTIDDDLPFIMNIFLSEAFEMLGTLVVLVISQPLLAAAFVPLAFIYRWIQAFYRQSSRELRRLSSVARSPVYSGFSEAIDGAPTIRGFSAQAAFSQQNVAGLEVLQRANYAGIAAAQWLSLRLQLLAAVVITIVAALGVASTAGMLPAFASYHHRRAGAGLIGLSLSYALSITDILNGVLTTSAETEQEMVSVERIQEYIQLPPQAPVLPQAQLSPASRSREGPEEAGPPSASAEPPAAHWPMPGRVEFMGVVLRYAGQSAPALDGLDLDVPGGSKIGVCGRTGAGKSSVLGALLRLTEIEAGQILIDSMDIRNVRLARLRSAVSVVPQSAFLFEGSVRDNLDPMGRHSDRELIAVLKSTRLWDILCGVSLSQSKGLARALAAQSTAAQPPRSASRPIQPRSPTAGSLRAGASPQTPSGSRQVPPLPKSGQRPGQRQSFSVPSTSYMPPADSPASSLAGSAYLGEGSTAGEASTSEAAGHMDGLRQKRHGPSRYFSERASTLAEALAGESTGVLFHTGFGGQLLNLRLGENGVGLSQGQQQLLCLARVLLRRPRIVCLDECTASVDPRTAQLMQELVAKELSSASIIQIAHRLESVMGCDQVAVMDRGRVVECGPPAHLLGDKMSHFSALHAKA